LPKENGNMKLTAKHTSILQIIFSLALLFTINFLADSFFLRWDLTEDGRYSLKDATIQLLEDDERFAETMRVEVYFDGDLPAEWRKLRREVEIKLEEYRAYAGRKFEYEFIDPFANPDEEMQKATLIELRDAGLPPMSIPVPGEGEMGIKTIVPGALIRYPGKDPVAVTFFPPGQIIVNASREYIRNKIQKSITDLEYNLTSGIRRATQSRRPVLAFITGHNELNENELSDIKPALEQYYDIEFRSLFTEDTGSVRREKLDALKGIDMAIIARPMKPFTEKEKFVIDQFIMNGGKAIWMIDGINPYRDSLEAYGRTLGLALDVNLTDQIFQYGLRINNNCILDEYVAPIGIPMQDGRLMIFPWYFYPMTGNRAVHPITNNLDPVKTEYVSSIDTLAAKPLLKRTILLESSSRSIINNPPVRIFYDWVLTDAKPNFSGNNLRPNQPVAVLLEGRFESLYKNRLPPRFLNSTDIRFIESTDDNKMLVISDGDLIRNDLDTISNPGRYRAVPIDMSYYTLFNEQLNGLRFGNKVFFLNAVDYLLGDASLLASRTRISVRMLDMDKVSKEKVNWQLLAIALPLLALFVAGILQSIIRKRRYVK
jgi:gliding-associated putative ABC transporter substrate-binding component GldG